MSEEIFYNSVNLAVDSNYKKLADLRNKFGSWERSWLDVKKVGLATDPENSWESLNKLGIKLYLDNSPEYPPSLKEIPFSPFGIYVLGKMPKDKINLGIVGTRKATYEGKELAKQFAAELSRAGICIVSGLALGIDAAAHEGCLEAGGTTVAVLGNGLDYFYPRTNERLAKKILDGGGAIISEYPPGVQPLPYRFLERNRIVSGLSRGVLVIEAPKESGSLVTASLALDQNRDVFVLPGPVSHPNFSGSHQLIRRGAMLITSTEEILEDLGVEAKEEMPTSEIAKTDTEQKIFAALKKFSAPATIDKILELTNLNISDVNQAITFLLLKDIIQETSQGYTLNK
ncbi:MAG: DNA-processing protein DprA [Patescibacteria group bacterium]|nr:DNA-processing protein DprA [Patescibacteria group bacterium]MDE2015335.1 DNA-processing protein DprA [Patescibacteria group bacterium]MDE2227140.1 DNA-processing protein DprA [Patescibacteria group bacterium]